MRCMYRKRGHSTLKHRCAGSTSDTEGLVPSCNEALKYSGSSVPYESPRGQPCAVKVQIH